MFQFPDQQNRLIISYLSQTDMTMGIFSSNIILKDNNRFFSSLKIRLREKRLLERFKWWIIIINFSVEPLVKVKGILFNIKADFILYEGEKIIINKEKDREKERKIFSSSSLRDLDKKLWQRGKISFVKTFIFFLDSISDLKKMEMLWIDITDNLILFGLFELLET